MQEKNSISWEVKTSEAKCLNIFLENSPKQWKHLGLAKWVENSIKKYSSLKVIGSDTATRLWHCGHEIFSKIKQLQMKLQ